MAKSNIKTQKSSTDKKDPTIAALIALACGLILAFPGAGYIYLGKVKKGLIYGILSWVIGAMVVIAYIAISFLTMGLGAICFPIFIVIPIYILIVVYDTYLDAKGDKLLLPDFN